MTIHIGSILSKPILLSCFLPVEIRSHGGSYFISIFSNRPTTISFKIDNSVLIVDRFHFDNKLFDINMKRWKIWLQTIQTVLSDYGQLHFRRKKRRPNRNSITLATSHVESRSVIFSLFHSDI